MASDSSIRPANGFLVFLGSAALFVGVAVVAIGALALNSPGGETLEQKRAAQRVATATRLENEAQEKLKSVGWVDKAKGVVRAPIADVLPIVVAELKARKPAPSQIKVEPPLPMPVIDPKATEPPPPALTSAPQGADTIRFALPAAVEAAPAVPAAVPVPTPAVPATPPVPVPAPPSAAPAPAPAPPVTNPPPALPILPPATTPASPVPAPVAPPAPARPPLINPTENSEPTK